MYRTETKRDRQTDRESERDIQTDKAKLELSDYRKIWDEYRVRQGASSRKSASEIIGQLIKLFFFCQNINCTLCS